MKGKKLLDITIQAGTVGVCGYNSRDKQKWKKLLCDNIKPLQSGVYKQPCCVRLQFYMTGAKSKTHDLDNLTKPVFSALEETVIENDRQVFNLDVTKFPSASFENESVHIELWEWQEI